MRLLPLFSVLLAGTALAQPVDSRETSIAGWPDVTAFIATVADLMPVNQALKDICGVIAAGELAISTIFGIPTTENDGCGDVTMFFARGTCDPGNVGALTGPWFFKTLEDKLKRSGKRLAVNGFDYPASVDGYLSGSKGNGEKLAAKIKSTIAACPNTKVVISGYSQGGMVVRGAAKALDAQTRSKVSAVVIFGDPYSKRAVENIDKSKVKIICHKGDNICDNGPIITFEHLNYALDAFSAADFVVSKV